MIGSSLPSPSDFSQIREAAVVGVDDEMFGQIVAAVVILEDTAALSIDGIQSYLKTRLAVYKLPRILRVVSTIPKNQLGKVEMISDHFLQCHTL
jgi:acyl-coenzyme A synthetase/AMP-(fatty) acid ligase